jgi:multisubunit Na+/H+ antiporter MnhB subunit
LPIAAAALFVVLYDLAVLWPRVRTASLVLFFVITVALWPLFEAFPDAGGPVTAVFLMGAVVAEVIVFRRDLKAETIKRSRLILYGVMGGLILVAGTSYLLGQTGRPLCDPTGLVQLHGLWHIASALAFGVFAETAFAPTSHIDQPAN